MLIQKCYYVSPSTEPEHQGYSSAAGCKARTWHISKAVHTALEDTFKLLEWKGSGININGESDQSDRGRYNLSTMLDDLCTVSQQVGLRMNRDKTNVMSNAHVTAYPISVGSSILERWSSRIGPIARRRSIVESILDGQRSGNYATSSSSKHLCASRWMAMTCGTDTWSLTVGLIKKLKVAQRAIKGLCSEFLCETD